MDCSTPGLPVHHQFPESTQTYVHWVGDAIHPSHPLSSPSPPALNLSQHQGLFKWVSSLHQVAKVLELQLQHQSFQWTPTKKIYLFLNQSMAVRLGSLRLFGPTILADFSSANCQAASSNREMEWILGSEPKCPSSQTVTSQNYTFENLCNQNFFRTLSCTYSFWFKMYAHLIH